MTYRTPPFYYRQIISKPDVILQSHSIPPNSTKQILSKNDRHSLTIINTSNFTIYFGPKESETIIPLQPNSSVYFQPHYIAISMNENGEQIFVIHCEWQDDLYIRNPDPTSNASVITYEVL